MWIRISPCFLVPVLVSVVVKVLLDTLMSAPRARWVSVRLLCLTRLRRWPWNLCVEALGVGGLTRWVVRLVRAVSSALVKWLRQRPLFLMNC